MITGSVSVHPRMEDLHVSVPELPPPNRGHRLDKQEGLQGRCLCRPTWLCKYKDATVYGPQPLLLDPPLPAKEARGVEADDSSIFHCHQRPPEGPDFESIDRYLAGAPSSRSVTLIREYFGFFLIAGSVILLLLNLRTLLELCTLRNLTRGMRALLRRLRGRRVHIQQRSGLECGGRDDADDIGTFEIPRPPKAVVVETIHTSLTYRLANLYYSGVSKKTPRRGSGYGESLHLELTVQQSGGIHNFGHKVNLGFADAGANASSVAGVAGSQVTEHVVMAGAGLRKGRVEDNAQQ
ncbi:hypothetical protein EGR_06381 [Echinococcus granulosus]|uniref:Uncharacterized protein n=1 Tax=Echinococcus granulosus TaxID=6210 RepID=W6UC26_ECHGR|nr:hypothetical protein EGR_06381 [Echinococcus granulosus]EUB58710.1 hypothetical protein EGR_06381 [Echinococcus granulosus]